MVLALIPEYTTESHLTSTGRMHKVYFWDDSQEESQLYATITEENNETSVTRHHNEIAFLENIITKLLEEIHSQG